MSSLEEKCQIYMFILPILEKFTANFSKCRVFKPANLQQDSGDEPKVNKNILCS